MSVDLRLQADVFTHHKVRRLRTRLGADGVLAWLKLLCYAAGNKPNGRLSGLNAEDIASVAEWIGDKDFATTLLELRLLDRHGKTFTLHNWSRRQPWVIGSEARREKAQKAASARWEKRESSTETEALGDSPNHAHGNATSIQNRYAKQAQSYAPNPSKPLHTQPNHPDKNATRSSPNGDLPSSGSDLQLFPNEGVRECDQSKEKKDPAITMEPPITAEDLVEVWNEILVPLGMPKTSELSDDRKVKVKARLKEHPDIDWWRTLFKKLSTSKFLRGENDRGWRCSFDFLIKNSTNALKIYEGNYDQSEKR